MKPDRHSRFRLSPQDLAQRRARLPVPALDADLPVLAAREAILDAIRQHPVTLVCGATGSGKTTQIPQLCLSLGRGVTGLIGCTQPRRLAARSVAQRLAAELSTPLGEGVGYQVRFHDRVSAHSYLKVMTDGILLAEIAHDPRLERYDTIIVDEAHERSLNIDFLLGYLKRLLPRRPDLKLVITSATLEVERLSAHFDGAPVIEVEGRTYPVEVRWRPLQAAEANPREETEDNDALQRGALLNAVDELFRETREGDVLVFLPGEREIRHAAEALRLHHPPHTQILPLFARQSLAEQERIFSPEPGRRIVLATNVAETSLTVPGIRHVVDTGQARVNRYSLRNKVTQLRIEKIAQASARQRAGRCGRVAPGVCIRLYDENDFNARPEYPTPEILRSSLAGVILRMASLGLGSVNEFPFLDPPSPRAIEDGYRLLGELGACDAQRRLTSLGRELAQFPIDPRIARMLVGAQRFGCLSEVLIIAAALSVQDPRERPFEQREAAAARHARFYREGSDFLSYLGLWGFFEEALKHRKSGRQLFAHCREHFLSLHRLREWRDIHAQLHALVAERGWSLNGEPAAADTIHRALLTGLLGQIGEYDPENQNYLGARGLRFWIAPAPGAGKDRPRWLMAAELTDTHRLTARQVARILPEWVEAAAGPLLQRSHSDPHWDPQAKQANAWEKVSLYGLILVPRRRIRLGPIDPESARRLFIRHALVYGELTPAPAPIESNRALVTSIETLEHKGRRQGYVVAEEDLIAFYEARLPLEVWSAERFERWCREAAADQLEGLRMTRDEVMKAAIDDAIEDLTPDHLDLGETRLPLRYRFEPGHPLDGVTLEAPLVLLPALASLPLDWLVPGMIREKVTTLLKGLPQRLRRHLVPLPGAVTAFLEQVRPDQGSLLDCLGRFVQSRTGEGIDPTLWCVLPEHLQMRIVLLDSKGTEVASGRDLAALREAWGERARAALDIPESPVWGREGLTAWDFGDLPESITLTRQGVRIEAWPALIATEKGVSLRPVESPELAHQLTREGILDLLQRSLAQVLKKTTLPEPLVSLYHRYYRITPARDPLLAEIVTRTLEESVPQEAGAIRRETDFVALQQAVRQRWNTRGAETLKVALELFESALAARDVLNGIRRLPAWAPNLEAIERHLEALCPAGSLATTPLSRLVHLPRYFKAIEQRLARLPMDPATDRIRENEVERLAQRLRQQVAQYPPSAAYEEFRWLLEELRVSLWAQGLKTTQPVSVKRLEKFWQERIAPLSKG